MSSPIWIAPWLRHDVEDVVAALDRGLGVVHRVVRGGRLGDAGEQRRLGEGQLARGLAEVALGGRFDAVVDAAVADLVHVPLEDLVLRVALGQLDGVDGLLDLAADRQRSWRSSSGM